jgi:hypothetical protein
LGSASPWGQPLPGPRGAFVIVLLASVLHAAPRGLDRRQPPAVQAASAQDAVQALGLPVLPRAPRGHKAGRDRVRSQPLRDRLRQTRRPIVPLAIPRGTRRDTPPLQPLAPIPCRDRPGADKGPALSGGRARTVRHGRRRPSVGSACPTSSRHPGWGAGARGGVGVLTPAGRFWRPRGTTWRPSCCRLRRTGARLPRPCAPSRRTASASPTGDTAQTGHP